MLEPPEEDPRVIALRVAPIAIAVVLAGYVIISFFPRGSPNVVGGYNALTLISLFLTVAFASFLVDALLRRRTTARAWAILLAAMVAVWAGGAALFFLLPRP